MAKMKQAESNQKARVKAGASKAKQADTGPDLFPIAGIGASAGGLEALEQLLGNIPANSGLAYVVIQHLDPTQKGMLPELLQRVSKMTVFQAKDNMVVKPNCVYVIPPNKSMSILNGALHLFEPLEIRGLRLPVDFFLQSLAIDRRALSIGIILSGMGSDGSAGLQAIKENDGIVMVQDPATAKFDSMPRNAINSVVADIIAPANELHQRLMLFLKQMPILKTQFNLEAKDKSALDKIIILLRTHTGNDFSLYKKNTLYRRIERRMGVHKIDKIASYIPFLQENPKEIEILFKELLIGVTNFFREPAAWEKLCHAILPEIIVNLPAGSNLRAWVAGCSTGEEAYTLAIIFKEALETTTHRNVSLQIFATDLDNDAIEIARKGLYPINIASDITPERLKRYFIKTEDGYRVSNDIREMVVFAQHNIIMHPPFTKIDILSCRNLLIYMDAELQKKILKLFYYSLNNNGIMLLGSSETVGPNINLFETLDPKLRIYERSNGAQEPDLLNFPSAFAHGKPSKIRNQPLVVPTDNIQSLADQILLQQFSPPGVLVNVAGDILYISGRTGKYLEPAAGKANLNIFAMLREGLRNEFPLAFHQAIRKRETVVLRNLKVGVNGNTQMVNITIRCIDKPVQLAGTVMIVFADVPDNTDLKPTAKSTRKQSASSKELELERELQNIREEMQSSVEEMQASQEELKSANEELQSSNEELQSTNEELTSSKEEMQSLNEELQTVNAELQAKVDDFSRVDNDMKNLLNSTDIATLFLDEDLNIRRYTLQATKIFKFIKSDIGRPFTDQVSDLIYPEMANDALEVLNTLVFKEKQIPGKDGQWFSIRIMPYRTFDDRIDGLVITFINITELKRSEEKLNESEQMMGLLFDASKDVIIKLSTSLKVLEFNQQAANVFGITRSEAISKDFVETYVHESVRKKAVREMHKLLNNMQDSRISLKVKAAGGSTPIFEWSVTFLFNNLKQATAVILKTESGQ
jgi:two-component system, chemotaxis family, CheB/CheR fusion protein